jgi:hypothetical protein
MFLGLMIAVVPAASASRHYVKGRTYEFHPVTTVQPYRDNICTATHQVARQPRTSSPTPAGNGGTPSVAHGAGTAPVSVVVLGLATAGGLGTPVVLLMARRRAAGSAR